MRFRLGSSSSGSPRTLLSKVGGSLFFAVFLGAGLLFAGLLALHVKQIAETYRWEKTPCIILASEAARDPQAGAKDDAYLVRIRYQYTIDSRTYDSDAVTSSPRRFGSYDKAREVSAAYPAGQPAVCFVDPTDAGTSVLLRDSLWQALFLLLPLIFIAVGGGGIYAMWAQPRSGTRAAVKDTTAQLKGGKWFGWIFVIVGGAFFHFLAVGPLLNLMAAQSWNEVPCQIVSSRVQTHDGDEGDTYSVDILYRYQVGAVTHQSSRYKFFGGSSSGYEGKREIVQKYAPGSTHTCFVDPADPDQAVLVREPGWEILLALIPIAFMGVGFVIIRAVGKKAPAAAPSLPPDGPVLLQPKASRMVRFFGVLVFAVIWNGVVSIFARNLWADLARDRASLFEILFFLPFALIGIGALIFAGICFLQLFNARVSLELDRPLRLGQSSELRWQCSGNTHALRTLQIELVGLEQAVYRQGTNNRTDRREFHRQRVFGDADSRTFTSGRIPVEVPADSVPSFEFGSNSIIWELHVRGSIRLWPDLSEIFILPVLPLLPRPRGTLPAMPV